MKLITEIREAISGIRIIPFLITGIKTTDDYSVDEIIRRAFAGAPLVPTRITGSPINIESIVDNDDGLMVRGYARMHPRESFDSFDYESSGRITFGIHNGHGVDVFGLPKYDKYTVSFRAPIDESVESRRPYGIPWDVPITICGDSRKSDEILVTEGVQALITHHCKVHQSRIGKPSVNILGMDYPQQYSTEGIEVRQLWCTILMEFYGECNSDRYVIHNLSGIGTYTRACLPSGRMCVYSPNYL